MWTRYEIAVIVKSKRAVITGITYSYPIMAAIFDLSVTRLSESVHTSPAVLLHPENVGVAFRISLLYFMEAEK